MAIIKKLGPRRATSGILVRWAAGSILLLFLLALGCGGGNSGTKVEIPPTADPGPPKFEYGSGAVILRIKADPMLNLFEDKAHTLVLCVYQFPDPASFQDLAKNKEGVIKLLSCQKYGQDIASAQKIIFQPGEVRTVTLDRAEGAKYVGLAAGYYNMDPQQATRLIKIPVDVATKGWIFKDKYQIPGVLDLKINLGPQEIREGGG